MSYSRHLILYLTIGAAVCGANAAPANYKCGESIEHSEFLQSTREELDKSLKAIDLLIGLKTTASRDKDFLSDRWMVEMLDISDFLLQGTRIALARNEIRSADDRAVVNGILGTHYRHVMTRLTPIMEHLASAIPKIRTSALTVEVDRAQSALGKVAASLKAASCQ
jgi:azurin